MYVFFPPPPLFSVKTGACAPSLTSELPTGERRVSISIYLYIYIHVCGGGVYIRHIYICICMGIYICHPLYVSPPPLVPVQGRALLASHQNFQLERDVSDGRGLSLVHGLMESGPKLDTFSLDFAAPLSPLVALAACLCSAEWQ